MKKVKETLKNIWGAIVNFIKKNKKLTAIIGVVIVVIIIALVLFFTLGKKENKREYLEQSLKEMAKDFYENYYYDYTGKTEEERANTLQQYSSIGIKIDLENLGRYNKQVNKEKIAEFVNDETGEACNVNNTRAIIYPKQNYGKTDYDIEVEFDCGFDTEEEK